MLSEATMPVAPAARDAANAVMPTASAEMPAPAARSPVPSANTPTPISARAPDKARMTGITGESTAPATPITVKAPASVIRLLAIASPLIAPSRLNTGARIASAPAATKSAAEPASVPFIRFNAKASSPSAIPSVTMLVST